MTDVHLYIDRPEGKDGTDLEDLRGALEKLEPVSNVDVDPAGNVVAVSFEGGRDEREEITRAVEAAGYGISRISARSDFEEESKLWDI